MQSYIIAVHRGDGRKYSRETVNMLTVTALARGARGPARRRQDGPVEALPGFVHDVRPEKLVEGLVHLGNPEGREHGSQVLVREHLQLVGEFDRRGPDPMGPVPRPLRDRGDASVNVRDPLLLPWLEGPFVFRETPREFRAHPLHRLDQLPLRTDAGADLGGKNADLEPARAARRLLRECDALCAVAAWADDHAEHRITP